MATEAEKHVIRSAYGLVKLYSLKDDGEATERDVGMAEARLVSATSELSRTDVRWRFALSVADV